MCVFVPAWVRVVRCGNPDNHAVHSTSVRRRTWGCEDLCLTRRCGHQLLVTHIIEQHPKWFKVNTYQWRIVKTDHPTSDQCKCVLWVAVGQCSGPGRLRHPWPTQRFSLESVLQQWVVQLREVSIWVFINNSYQRGKWNSGDLNASHWLTVMAKELLQMSWIQIICIFWIKYFSYYTYEATSNTSLSEDSETPIEGQICMTDQVIFNFS